MPAIHDPPVTRPPKQLRRKPSDASPSRRSTYSNDSRASLSSSPSPPPSPTPASPEPSPRAVEISAAFERVHDRSTTLQTTLLECSEVTTRKHVKDFQNAVMTLFGELQHLPDDVPPSPALISAIQGCSFEVLCFASSAERFRVGHEGWEKRWRELEAMLNEAMASVCVLLELAAQAIEDAGAERDRLEESTEADTTKAEWNFGSGFGSSVDGRPLSWLVPMVNDSGPGPPGLQREPPLVEHLRKVSSTNLKKPPMPPSNPTPPSTPNQPIFLRKEPLIPMKRPSKGKYDIRHLRKSIHLHHLADDTPPLRDSLAIIGGSAPFPADLPKSDHDDPDAPYVEYSADGSVTKANLRGLVGVITSGNAIEHEEFVSMVLTTFRLFASGQNLADALYFRYTEQQPEWLARKGRTRFEWGMAEKRMKARVATILHLWLELYWKPEDSGAIMRLQQLVETIEKDCVFHAQSLRMSLDRIAKEKDYHGRRFRTGERYKPTTAPPPPTSFAARGDLAALATRNQTSLKIVHFATPEGVVEFARMMTMVESRYYHKLSPENFVHYKSEETLKLRKELGDFEQRYKAWIVWTIVTPKDPIERAHIIEFWFEVAKSCIRYRNFNTAHQITCVLGDPEFEKMVITRQVLEQLAKTSIYEFWKVCRLYENEGWWREINSSSLPAIPVSHVLIRWRIYIEECGLRGLCKQTRDFSLPEFKNEGRIDVDSFLNLADLVWDIERTYEPHAFVQVPWIENWFLGQVFASDITDFGLETRHLRTGVANDNPAPVVPDNVLAKLVAMFEAKLRRKGEVKLIPLVPRKSSVEVIKQRANKLKKRPSALVLHSQSRPSSPRPGTPTSQDSDTQIQRRPNKLHKRSMSLTRSSPESIQQSLPVQSPGTPPPPAPVVAVTAKDRDRDKAPEVVLFCRPSARSNLGPPPSPSHGKRFEGMGVPRRSLEKIAAHPLRVGSPIPAGRANQSSQDWEIV